MSRRSETGEPTATRSAATTPTRDDYLGRLAKYIPAEVVDLYVAMAAAAATTNPHCRTSLWVICCLNAARVPLYMWIVTSREGKKPLWSQIVLASLAFPDLSICDRRAVHTIFVVSGLDCEHAADVCNGLVRAGGAASRILTASLKGMGS